MRDLLWTVAAIIVGAGLLAMLAASLWRIGTVLT